MELMHKNVLSAFNEIDAAVFSGDTFYDADALAVLKMHIARWQKKMPDLEDFAKMRDGDCFDEEMANEHKAEMRQTRMMRKAGKD